MRLDEEHQLHGSCEGDQQPGLWHYPMHVHADEDTQDAALAALVLGIEQRGKPLIRPWLRGFWQWSQADCMAKATVFPHASC